MQGIHRPLLIAALSMLLSPLAVGASAADSNPSTAAVHWTPVLIAAPDAPRGFKGSEGKWHLVYDLVLTNYNPVASSIKEFQILGRNGGGEFHVVKSLTGQKLKDAFSSLTRSQTGANLDRAQVGVLFVNLDFDRAEDVPAELTHKIIVDTTSPTGKPWALDYSSAPLKVDNTPAVRLAPPLRGGKWCVMGGYAGTLGHRRALFAIDNQFKAAQTFAIDWMRLDDQNYAMRNPSKIEGDSSYDQPIYAVADGTVLGVVNKFQDQTPGKITGEDRWSYPGGNSVVIDIGNGNYAFYAHLKHDSIKVKEGDKVTRGQEIARLGNTGNSSGPHLHMHVTRDPGILDANGVPYVFDEFEVLGEIKDMKAFESTLLKGKPATFADSDFKGTHHDELPREGFVLRFPTQ